MADVVDSNTMTADEAHRVIKDFVEMFRSQTGNTVTNVTMKSGKVINFDEMTDEDAIRAARGLLDMEAQGNKARVQ